MIEKEIPIPYKVILKRFWRNSDYGKLTTRKARIILVQIFRMEKCNASLILDEMKCRGLIELDNHKFIRMNINIEDLV